MERIILTTGGTGGHIFPALAVAEEIRARSPKAMLLFMGGKYGQEADLAAKAGLDFKGLPVRGIMGRGLRSIPAAVGMGRGVLSAVALMRQFKPELVVGFGGYAAFAGVLAGRLYGAATALHEQNAFPGMTNRVLGRLVQRVFLSMPDASGVFDPKKCVLTGNPVREGVTRLYEDALQRREAVQATADGHSYYGGVDAPSPFAAGESGEKAAIVAEESEEQRQKPRLLVMGGSLGARAINDGMLEAIGDLLDAGIEVWHQTGQSDYERMRAAYREIGAGHVRVEPFILDMPRAYAWADLLFCRAGASSLAEITAAGLPSLLAPFPQAAQDHQRYNARFMEGEGAARILEQAEFLRNKGLLARTLLDLLRDREQLALMSERSLAAAKPYAARELVNNLEQLLSEARAARLGG